MNNVIGDKFIYQNPICLAIINSFAEDINPSVQNSDIKSVEGEFNGLGVKVNSNVWRMVESAYKDFIHDSVFFSTETTNYINVLTRLRELLRNCEEDERALSSNSEEGWKEAVLKARIIDHLSPDLMMASMICERHVKAAKCAKCIHDLKIEATFDGRYGLSDKGSKQLHKLLSNKGALLSGSVLMGIALLTMGGQFKENSGRVVVNIKASNPYGVGEPTYPWNLYLNIIAKNFTEPFVKPSEDRYQEFKDIISNVAGMYDVQPLSQAEGLNIPPYKMAETIVDKSLFSSFCDIPQMDEQAAIDVISLVKEKFSNNEYLRISIENWCDYAISWLRVHETDKPVLLKKKDMANMSGIPLLRDAKTVGSFFFANSYLVNPDFSFPFSGANFYQYPGISSRRGDIYLKNRTFAARGYVERVFSACRCSGIRNFNGKIGLELESLLSKLHVSNGIDFYSGRYGTNNNETDGVIFTDDDIHIFEFKIKALTERSKAGDFVSTFADLVKSLLDSQRQAWEVAYSLNKDGFIKFKKTGDVIDYSGQQIHFHSISLFDYGFLQNKTFVSNLLTGMATYGFSHTDKLENEKLEALNESLDKFREVIFRCQELGILGRVPFLRSSFLSLSDLYLLRRRASDKDAYLQGLSRINSVEYAHAPPSVCIANIFDLEDSVRDKVDNSLS